MKTFIRTTVLLAALISPLTYALNFVDFDPRFEGTFNIRITCRADDKSPACTRLHPSYYLVVLNRFSEIRITVLEKQSNRAAYRFSATSYNAADNELEGNAFAFGENPTSEIQLSYSQEPGKEGVVTGYLRDANFQYDAKIEGVVVHTPAKFFKKKSSGKPIAASDIIGFYQGTWFSGSPHPITFNIRKSATTEGFLANSTLLESGNSTSFIASHLYAESDALTLIAKGFNQATCSLFENEFMKWTLSIQEGADGSVTLFGRGTFSFSPGYSDIRLELNRL